MLTSSRLKHLFPKASDQAAEEFVEIFIRYADDYGITTSFLINAFLAQLIAEDGTRLKSVRENLNYRCSALRRLFGYYRRNPSHAVSDGRCNGHKANQENIGNRAYANRIGNGSVDSGDGWHFRGGGFFQLTGRSNYAAMAAMMPEATTAEELAEQITTVKYGLLSAMAFFKHNNLADCKDIDEMTKKINIHTASYAKRKALYKHIAEVLI